MLKISKCVLACIYFTLLLTASNSWAANALEKLQSLPSSSLLLEDTQNQTIYSKNANQLFIPASTVKILTALIALDHWGKDYQFSTNFYLNSKTNTLWIKGQGDPFLISEEIDLIVKKIKQIGITELDGIGVDTSYYQKSILIDGQDDSLNPYDAPNSSLAANFNTVNVRVYTDSISSSETQTPLTPIAEEISRGLEPGSHRINLGETELGPRYFVELLKAKLNRAGVLTNTNYMSGDVSKNIELLFTHQNSKTLEKIIASMLEYSNNFIANQLYLNLGAEIFGAPASLEKSQRAVNQYINSKFAWKNYSLVEGSGLSKKNRLSAQQLMDVLRLFNPYRPLMPNQNDSILAKSGTLKNVSTYAGYVHRNNQWSPFALMINQKVSYSFREQVALELLK